MSSFRAPDITDDESDCIDESFDESSETDDNLVIDESEYDKSSPRNASNHQTKVETSTIKTGRKQLSSESEDEKTNQFHQKVTSHINDEKTEILQTSTKTDEEDNLLTDESEDDISLPKSSRKSQSETSANMIERGRKHLNRIESSSDDEEPTNKSHRKVKSAIESNSESEEHQIDDSDSSLSLHSNIEDDDVPEETNRGKGRISDIHNFGNKGSIMNSTKIDEAYSAPLKLSPRKSIHNETTKMMSGRSVIIVDESSTTRRSTPRARPINTAALPPSMTTPRIVRQEVPSRSPSLSLDEDVVEMSSVEEVPFTPRRPKPNQNLKQATLDSLINIVPKTQNPPARIAEESVIELNVSPSEFKEQKEKIQKLHSDLLKTKNMLRTVNLNALPDKGKLLQERYASLERQYNNEAQKLNIMNISKEDPPAPLAALQTMTWTDIQAGAAQVQPATFGKKAMATYNNQKALTMDRLKQLHGAIESCPKEDTMAEDPKGLTVELMPHQKRALAWMLFREKERPSGGILADDMGLGKTLTMISLMLKSNEIEKHKEISSSENEENREEEDEEEEKKKTKRRKYNGGTLVVCPASLLNQWSGELETKGRRGLASYYLYHGTKRERKAKVLADYDMVITTYSIVQNENPDGAIFRVKWRRIILDEAHQIRNYKSRTSLAVCYLHAKSRWALTGTPIHNKELDMFALLKFLRCSPFDDLVVWKRWVADKSSGGVERLHTVISSLMLRRTKAELMEKGALNCLPERKWELISVQLDKVEQEIYQRVNLFSRTLFAQFLHQRAVKNQDIYDANYAKAANTKGPNNEYFKMRDKLLKMNNIQDISQHHILVLLLRLRQICCHPSLITAMLDESPGDLDHEDEELQELNILEQLNKLNLDGDDTYHENESSDNLKTASKGLLNPSNPVFSHDHMSSKIKAVMKVVKERVINNGDKAIVVSQFPSFLRIVGKFFKEENIEFDQLDGSIPVNKRMTMVDSFNNPKHKMQVLLLSLTAGGVGLNLIGANHLILLDLHWNPQLENQAQDRIYRVGQKKPVFVYKFMTTDTIEERIKELQDSKLDCANAMLTGTKQVLATKLSLNDLKMLFQM
ncbi:transcription termination factor 2 isoform X2 [Aethina tumida]|uniref:transcription termination factor 2 isoform X2 n=1 Tax=Aethina tumida TaxID=116153 RepID=UPI00096B3CD9|nr:transcription termination factor 2 isoform X2 [Aethina tumida]